MSSELDPAVIAAAQAGDGQARDRIVTESMPLVYNIVGRALHGHADVDDVAQETMLRASPASANCATRAVSGPGWWPSR